MIELTSRRMALIFRLVIGLFIFTDRLPKLAGSICYSRKPAHNEVLDRWQLFIGVPA